MEENQDQVNSNIQGSSATSTPTSQSTQPLPTSPQKRSKLIYVFVALLVLLVLTTTASIWANLYKGSQIKITTAPTSSPTPAPTSEPTAKWKTVKTSFAELKVPQDWDLWDCGNGTFVIMINNPQGSAHECPFDGQQLLYFTPQTNPYENLDSVAVQPQDDPNSVDTTTVSDVTRTIVDGKDAVIWKTTIAPRPGQESGPGTGIFFNAAIMPNIKVQGDYKEEATIRKVLSSINFTK